MPLKRFWKNSDNCCINHVVCWLILGLCALFSSCTSFDYLTEVTEQSFPQASQCSKCHVDIYHEWVASDHATAYNNPHFQQATNNYTFEECLSCHAPQPFRSDHLTTRKIDRGEGITCVSCHLEQGKLSGPLEPTGKVTPHPVTVNPDFYKNNKICGTCHQGEFAEWENADVDGKQTCQDCHMPEVIRKVTQPTGGISNLIVAFEEEVEQKKHDFSIVSLNSDFETISIETKKINASEIILTIRNNLPHSLPAGDFGFRVLILEIFAVDSKENRIRLDHAELAKENQSSILPLATRNWQLKIPPETEFLQIAFSRLSYDQNNIPRLVDIKVPLP